MEQKDLAQVSQKMTRTEQRINACYQAHPDEFAFGTLEELAALTSTSTASIIRYCRRMGYGGFRAFQEKLREEMRSQVRLPDRIQRQETAEEMSRLRQTVDQNRDCVEQTLAYLTEKQLEQLVQKVADSRRIFVFGMRISGTGALCLHEAYYPERKCVFAGRRVQWHAGTAVGFKRAGSVFILFVSSIYQSVSADGEACKRPRRFFDYGHFAAHRADQPLCRFTALLPCSNPGH